MKATNAKKGMQQLKWRKLEVSTTITKNWIQTYYKNMKKKTFYLNWENIQVVHDLIISNSSHPVHIYSAKQIGEKERKRNRIGFKKKTFKQ